MTALLASTENTHIIAAMGRFHNLYSRQVLDAVSHLRTQTCR